MKIGKRIIGNGSSYFIVEEGVANLGNPEKAIQIIDYAAESGAEAIEFQVFNADDFVIKTHKTYAFLSEIQLQEKDWKVLIKHTHSKNMHFIATALSPTMVGFLIKSGCDAFNINATDINNPDVLDAVARSGLPFFLSVPLATESEISWAVKRIRKSGATEFGILHGQHTMFSEEGGIPIRETSLGFIRKLKKKYKIPSGFIDHTPNIWTPSLAVAAGADIITKHLAISREEKGPDWHICLEPGEMKEAIRLVRETERSLCSGIKTLASGEDKDVPIMRKSIVAARNMKKGHVISREDIVFKRPGTGIPPNKADWLTGKRTTRVIEADEIINTSDIK